MKQRLLFTFEFDVKAFKKVKLIVANEFSAENPDKVELIFLQATW